MRNVINMESEIPTGQRNSQLDLLVRQAAQHSSHSLLTVVSPPHPSWGCPDPLHSRHHHSPMQRHLSSDSNCPRSHARLHCPAAALFAAAVVAPLQPLRPQLWLPGFVPLVKGLWQSLACSEEAAFAVAPSPWVHTVLAQQAWSSALRRLQHPQPS